MTPRFLDIVCRMPANSPRLALLTVLTLAAGVAVACDGGTTPEPSPDHDLLTQIQDDKYEGWARPAGYEEEPRPTNSPHGGVVVVYTNAVVVDAVANKDGLGLTAWPDDATIVLEGFVDAMATEPAQIAVMQKRHGSWYWEQYQAEDLERPRFAGRPDICLGCHSAGQDFVRSFALPKLVVEE